jgi:hypothetical protein
MTEFENIPDVKTSDLRNDNSKRVVIKHSSTFLLRIPLIHKIKISLFKNVFLQRWLRKILNKMFYVYDEHSIRVRKYNYVTVDPEFIAQVSIPSINDLLIDDQKLFEKIDYAIKNTHSINYDRHQWIDQFLNNHIFFTYAVFKSYRHQTRKLQVPSKFPLRRE